MLAGADSASRTKLITLRPASNFSLSSCSTRSLSVTESRRDFNRLSALSKSAMAVRTSRTIRSSNCLRARRDSSVGPAPPESGPCAVRHRTKGKIRVRRRPNRWRRFPGTANWRGAKAAACRSIAGSRPECSNHIARPRRADRCAAKRTCGRFSARSLARISWSCKSISGRPASAWRNNSLSGRRRVRRTPACTQLRKISLESHDSGQSAQRRSPARPQRSQIAFHLREPRLDLQSVDRHGTASFDKLIRAIQQRLQALDPRFSGFHQVRITWQTQDRETGGQ